MPYVVGLIAIAAAFEALTGVVTIVAPTLLVRLLFGAPLTAGGVAVSRVAGFALLALGLACWPGREPASLKRATRGLFTYNALVAVFLLYLGIRGHLVGLLLWPAAIVHAILAILLSRNVVER